MLLDTETKCRAALRQMSVALGEQDSVMRAKARYKRLKQLKSSVRRGGQLLVA